MIAAVEVIIELWSAFCDYKDFVFVFYDVLKFERRVAWYEQCVVISRRIHLHFGELIDGLNPWNAD